MDLFEALRQLTQLVGVPGYEDDVRAFIRERVTPLADEVTVDARGNLLAFRHGKSERRLMVDAHLDEIGFMVTFIEPSGFLRFGPIGTWDPRLVPGSRALVRTQRGEHRPGVIGALPPHVTQPAERESVIPLETLAIDVGASSADEVAALGLEVGDTAVLDAGFGRLAGNRVYGRAFDDRVACAVLFAVMERIREADLPWTLAACFSISEERLAVGIGPAAYGVRPDLALCLETTTATDMPGVSELNVVAALGRGPAITLADRSVTVPSWYSGAIRQLAQREKIPFQLKRPLVGGTNAAALERTGGGCPTAVVSVPARNIHSAVSIVDLGDVEETSRLLEACVLDAPGLMENRSV